MRLGRSGRNCRASQLVGHGLALASTDTPMGIHSFDICHDRCRNCEYPWGYPLTLTLAHVRPVGKRGSFGLIAPVACPTAAVGLVRSGCCLLWIHTPGGIIQLHREGARMTT